MPPPKTKPEKKETVVENEPILSKTVTVKGSSLNYIDPFETSPRETMKTTIRCLKGKTRTRMGKMR